MLRGLIVGTGPSLRGIVHLIPRFDGLLFICNNCWTEEWVWGHYLRMGYHPVWLSCDPAWHEHYGQVDHPLLDKWHWSKEICDRFGYRFVEGVWMDGLWMEDKSKISLNHCSGAQLLNLAANQYECDEIVLIGHDFDYPKGQPRHYFSGLSDKDGEYPEELRKFSKFDKQGQGNDLLNVYRHIANQEGLPPIYNATKGSKLPWFPYADFKQFIHPRAAR